jgi:micrococcal nuclease
MESPMNKKILVIGAMILLIIAGYLVMVSFQPASDETYEVESIIDGDTIKLTNGERVRLIGINTPERGQPYYQEATEKLEELIGSNPVRLEADEENEDQYGRWLRYIYVNDTFVNLEIVKSGLATAYEFQPNVKYSDKFSEAEQTAKNSELGIWIPSPFSLTVITLHADAEGDDGENLNDEYVVFDYNGTTSINLTNWWVMDEANNEYRFQNYVLVEGFTATLYTGSGTDTLTKLYWGSTKPIWNNDGDSLYLKDAEGLLVTYYSY